MSCFCVHEETLWYRKASECFPGYTVKILLSALTVLSFMCTNIPPPFHLLLYQSTSNSAAQARKHSPVSQTVALSITCERLQCCYSEFKGTNKKKWSIMSPLNHVRNRCQKAVQSFGKHLRSFLKKVDLKNIKKGHWKSSLFWQTHNRLWGLR